MQCTKLVSLFESDYYISSEAVKEATVNRTVFNIIHNETVVKIDFIIKKPEEYRRIEFDRKIKRKINDFEAWLVSKEDLILSKLICAKDSKSAMQLTDVKSLLASGQYDTEYLLMWAKKLGVSELLSEMFHE